MIIKKNDSTVEATTTTNYSAAQRYIKAAIDALGKHAKEDILAQESIANLSVVLLDLQQ